jgi:hypothetical protein
MVATTLTPTPFYICIIILALTLSVESTVQSAPTTIIMTISSSTLINVNTQDNAATLEQPELNPADIPLSGLSPSPSCEYFLIACTSELMLTVSLASTIIVWTDPNPEGEQ